LIRSELKSKITEDICVMATPDNHPYSYLFDCGVASNLQISDVMRTKAVFTSHTHVDHFVNFDAILRNRAGSRNTLIVTGPKGIVDNVQGKLKAYTWNLIGRNGSYFEVREVQRDGVYKVFRLSPPDWRIRYIRRERNDLIFQNGSISVRFCVLDHKIDSIAYRMQENTRINMTAIPYKPGPWIESLKEAFRKKIPDVLIQVDANQTIPAAALFHCLKETEGFSLGYAMDHLGGGQNHEKLAILFKNLDELYIESFFRHVDWDFAKRHHHCTSYLSGLLARRAGVKKLNLVHHSRRYFADLRDLIEEGLAAFEGREPNYNKKPHSRFQAHTKCTEDI
tara:strand:- start:1082 stop:2092 length:1011 start_codon:yes stop_codon:yes gene_type:complete